MGPTSSPSSQLQTHISSLCLVPPSQMYISLSSTFSSLPGFLRLWTHCSDCSVQGLNRAGLMHQSHVEGSKQKHSSCYLSIFLWYLNSQYYLTLLGDDIEHSYLNVKVGEAYEYYFIIPPSVWLFLRFLGDRESVANTSFGVVIGHLTLKVYFSF